MKIALRYIDPIGGKIGHFERFLNQRLQKDALAPAGVVLPFARADPEHGCSRVQKKHLHRFAQKYVEHYRYL